MHTLRGLVALPHHVGSAPGSGAETAPSSIAASHPGCHDLYSAQAYRAPGADYVLAGLQEFAERTMQRVPVLDRLGNETGQWTFKAGAATRAFELMGRHLGMFVDRHEHSGPGGVLPLRSWPHFTQLVIRADI